MSLLRDDVARDQSAKLVEVMIKQAPWKDRPWARLSLSIAARAIRRGRHLTDDEKFENLMRAMLEEDRTDAP